MLRRTSTPLLLPMTARRVKGSVKFVWELRTG